MFKVLPIYAVSFVDAVIILISIQRKKCTFYSRFLPSLIRCSVSSQKLQPPNFFSFKLLMCHSAFITTFLSNTSKRTCCIEEKGKKWGLWNEIKGQSTNKVIKEIITFACRLSLCVIALFSESFCGNIAESNWGFFGFTKITKFKAFSDWSYKHNNLVVLASHLIENVIFHCSF